MNLSALTDPLPKNYMNINCNTLTANQVIDVGQESSAFNAYQSSPTNATPSVNLPTACDTFRVASSNFNLATNVYTVPRTGKYYFSIETMVTNTVAVQDVKLSINITVNNLSIGAPPKVVQFPTVSLTLTNSVSNSAILSVNAGDQIRYSLLNTGTVACLVSNTMFYGFEL